METLVREFPDNDDYLTGYLQLLKVEPENTADLYKEIQEKYKSKVAHLGYLGCLNDREQFKQEFTKFVVPYYRRNIISLFR